VQGKLPGGTYDASTGFTTFTAARSAKPGGYTSLAFDSANRPHVSFYDAAISGLRYGRSSGDSQAGVRFAASTVSNDGAVGAYSNLFFDDTDRPTIFYFDKTRGKAMRAVFSANRWSTTALADGGRGLHVARDGDTLAYTNLNEDVPALQVLFARDP
jgi:hypothetical protein